MNNLNKPHKCKYNKSCDKENAKIKNTQDYTRLHKPSKRKVKNYA